MSDRCPWRAFVRKSDLKAFNRIAGNTEVGKSNPAFSVLENSEANYGSHLEMLTATKQGCVFHGHYGPGTEYGSYMFASDGVTYEEWETSHGGDGYVITPRTKAPLEQLAESLEAEDVHRLHADIEDLKRFLTWYGSVVKKVEEG